MKQVSEISSVPVSTPDPVSAPEIDPVLVTSNSRAIIISRILYRVAK